MPHRRAFVRARAEPVGGEAGRFAYGFGLETKAERVEAVLTWTPRIQSLVLLAAVWGVLIGEIAGGALAGMHALRIGAVFILFTALVALSWRWQWIGACVFTAVALAYGSVPFLDRFVRAPNLPFAMWDTVRVTVYFTILIFVAMIAVLYWWDWIARSRTVSAAPPV